MNNVIMTNINMANNSNNNDNNNNNSYDIIVTK